MNIISFFTYLLLSAEVGSWKCKWRRWFWNYY